MPIHQFRQPFLEIPSDVGRILHELVPLYYPERFGPGDTANRVSRAGAVAVWLDVSIKNFVSAHDDSQGQRPSDAFTEAYDVGFHPEVVYPEKLPRPPQPGENLIRDCEYPVLMTGLE